MTVAIVGRMGRPRKSEPTDPLRMPRSIVKRLRRVASHKGEDPGDLAARLIASSLNKEESKMLQEIEQERADAD